MWNKFSRNLKWCEHWNTVSFIYNILEIQFIFSSDTITVVYTIIYIILCVYENFDGSMTVLDSVFVYDNKNV